MAQSFPLGLQTNLKFMKKILVKAMALLFTGTTIVNAQTVKKTSDISFGLRGGLNLSNIIKTNDNNYSTDIKPGLNAAAFVEIPIGKGFSFQPEFQFSQKGYISNGNFLTSSYEYSVTTNYVEIPLLAKVNPSGNFSIVAGPQFSFLASTKTKFKSGSSTYETMVRNDNDNLRRNILGGVLGMEVASKNAVFALRYNLDFQNNNGDGTSSTPKYRNQVLGLSIGFKL